MTEITPDDLSRLKKAGLTGAALALVSPIIILSRFSALSQANNTGVYSGTTRSGVNYTHSLKYEPIKFRRDIIEDKLIIAFFIGLLLMGIFLITRALLILREVDSPSPPDA